MRRLSLFIFIFIAQCSFAQYAFEGTIIVTNRVGATTYAADIKFKDGKALIRQTENPIKKYSYFLVNLNTRMLQTVALKDTMVVIDYHLDSLLAFYELHQLKSGFRNNYNVILKETDKSVNDGTVKMVKATGEDNLFKITAWLVDDFIPLNELVPFLRLIGDWNEAQSNTKKVVLQADVVYRASKKESSVKAIYFKEKLPDTLFELPKSVVKKDFSKLMQEQRNNQDLKILIQAFCGF